MSIHDYDLANSAGIVFRADLNNVLSAIVSQNSSLTEPTTLFAYMWWADTTTAILKQRNAGNSAWNSLFNLTTGQWLGSTANITVVDAAADTTTWPMLATSQTGNQAPATDAGLTYNASTNVLGASISGNAATATELLSSSTVAASAYLSVANQSLTSGVFAKVTLNAEEFDTNANFDSTTNYRFTPTVAGYYSVSWAVALTANANTLTTANSQLRKNGSGEKYGYQFLGPGANYITSPGSCIVYMNGTTDYLELWASVTGTTPLVIFGSTSTYFNVCILRP